MDQEQGQEQHQQQQHEKESQPAQQREQWATTAGIAASEAIAMAAAARLGRMGFCRDWMLSSHCHVGIAHSCGAVFLVVSVSFLRALPTVAVATDVGGVADRSIFDHRREQLCNSRIQVATKPEE